MHARVMQLGSCVFSYLALVAVNLIFHVMTVGEYYEGSLLIPKCSGVSDTSFVLYANVIVAGIWGNDMYLAEVYKGWRVNDIFNAFIITSQLLTALNV